MDKRNWSKDELNAFLESLDGYNPEVDTVREIEDGECDFDIQALGHLIEIDERKDSVLNLEVLKRIEQVYGMLKHEFENSGTDVSYALHRPYQSMGYVMAEGKSIRFKNTSVLRKCMELASNTEAYPMAKDAVRITFTFHGLTNKIREVGSV